MSAQKLITEHLDLWTAAITKRSSSGRGSNSKIELSGIKKLRELILELAVYGKLGTQSSGDLSAELLIDKASSRRKELVAKKSIRTTQKLPPVSDDEAPAKLPSKWVWTRLGSISEVNPRNSADDTIEASFVPMPMITTSHSGEHSYEVRKWGEIKSGYTHFSDGDIGLAKITPCFENSKAVVFRNLENGVGAGTTELHVARPLIAEINPFFILLFLKSPKFLRDGEAVMTGSAGQKRVPKDYFEQTPLPLPPEKEQSRIVQKVDELMTLCDRLEQQTSDQLEAHETLVDTLLGTLTQSENATDLADNWARLATHFDTLFTTEQSIDKLKQTILQLAVMGRLVGQDGEEDSGQRLATKIVQARDKLACREGMRTKASDNVPAQERYLRTPESWAWIRMGNTAKFIDYRGKTPSKTSSGIRLITAKNIRQGYIDFEPQEFISEIDYASWMTRGFPRNGDLLFTTEAPLGNAAIVEISEDFALAQRAICFQWHLPEISKFMLIQFLASPFQAQLIGNATGMTATGIKSAKLKEIPVCIPPLEEQRRIVQRVDELMTLCDQLRERLNQASETRCQLADAIVEQAIS